MVPGFDLDTGGTSVAIVSEAGLYLTLGTATVGLGDASTDSYDVSNSLSVEQKK